jgi:DNA-binding NarL/FixJ family response regulator
MSMRRSSPVLVGREDDRLALEEAVADREARPVILVGGEAGVGKTRLVAELMACSTTAGAMTTAGSCIHLGADVLPYAPFVDALGRYVEALGDRAGDVLGAARADLAALLPDLGVDEESAGAASRGRVYEAVRGLLDRPPAPLVFVLEDIHWADSSSLELMAYLASRLRHGRTAIVATFRTDELHRRHPLVPVLAELARSGRTTRLDLPRLGREQVASLVREIRHEAPDSLVAAIAGRSEGNPFLVEELLAVDAGPATPLPETLRDLLLARLGSLSEPSRRVLGIVAVVGRPVDAELVEATWDGSPSDLDSGLREAVDRAMLVVEPSGGRVAFRHALLGEAVADDLLPGERVRLHAALARILADRPDLASPTRAGAAAEIAHHLYEARDLPAALAASASAGDAAVAARAYSEAREQYERALDLLERIPDAGEGAVDRIRLLDAAAEASFHSGNVARAVALGRRAVEESDTAGDPSRTGYLLGRLIEWTELTGDYPALEALAERAIGLVPADPPTRDRAYVLIGMASARMHADLARQALPLARAAIDVGAACGAVGQEAIARSIVAAALAELGHDSEAVAEIDRAVVLVERSRGTEETSVVQSDRAIIRGVTGRFADLADILEDACRAVDREGSFDVHEPWLAVPEIDLLAWQGRWSEAEALATRMIEKHSSPSPLACHLVTRAKLRARSGRGDDAVRDLRAALDLRPPVEATTRADALGVLAEAALERGDHRDALRLLAEGLAVLAPTDEVPGRVHLFALALQAAADLAQRARARRDSAGESEASAAAQPYLAGLRAAAAGELVAGGATEGRVASRIAWGLAEERRRAGASDPGAWAAAATALTAAGEPYLAARLRYREAEAMITGPGDRNRAEEILRATLAWATGVGAEPLRRDVESLARRARLDLTAPSPADTPPSGDRRMRAPADPYGLSRRERDVLALLVEGRTNREIGATLFISEKTASVHVTHILDKLGVTSRGAAAALAARGGLVGGPEA